MAESALLAEGRRRLEQAMLPGGGWGYRQGGQPFVEPTALALLALAPRDPPSVPTSDNVVARSVTMLLSCQREQGYFGTSPEDHDPSWATAPALIALTANGVSTGTVAAGEWLAGWKAPKEPPSEKFREAMKRIARVDVTIRGWPSEADDAFAVVAPTSLACIALRAWGGQSGAGRIDEGLRYLADRACSGGGWNYGNPYYLEDPLPPITLPTAVGLLALGLCGQPHQGPLVVRSTTTLSRLLEHNPSRKAHAWSALAFAALADRAGAAEQARAAVDTGDGRGAWGGGGPDVIALAVLALRAASGEAPACLSATRT